MSRLCSALHHHLLPYSWCFLLLAVSRSFLARPLEIQAFSEDDLLGSVDANADVHMSARPDELEPDQRIDNISPETGCGEAHGWWCSPRHPKLLRSHVFPGGFPLTPWSLGGRMALSSTGSLGFGLPDASQPSVD